MSPDVESCTLQRWLSIVGIGEDGIDGLSATARRLIENAALVVGGARHLKLAQSLVLGRALAWPSTMSGGFDEIARHAGTPVVVLASGDPFHYGVGKDLVRRFSADCMLALPQPSAFSLAASRLGWPLQDVSLVTLHGRALEGIIRHLQPGARILALSWDGTTPMKVAALLQARGFGRSRMTVLEALGGPREQVRSEIAQAATFGTVAPLNTIAVECVAYAGAHVLPLASGLDDTCFESDGQLTKREIRALTLSSLAPRQGECLWDIGLGAGSVAIEWLLCHPSLTAIGIEENHERAARAARNAAALGTPDLKIVHGHAPEALAGLPPPHAIFIGGGFTDDGVFDAAWRSLQPGGRLVANAVTLETEQRLLSAQAALGGELSRIQISRSSPVGTVTGWRPAMPVTHWRVVKQ